MLDDHDGVAALVDALDKFQQAPGLGRVHAGGRFVQQQDLGVGGQRPGDLHLALQAVGQVARFPVLVFGQAHFLQHLGGLLGGIFLVLAVAGGVQQGVQHIGPGMDVAAHLHVFQHRKVLEQLDVLEGTHDAQLGHFLGGEVGDVPPVKQDLAGGHLVSAGAEIEKGGLAGAVGADDAEDLALFNLHVHVVDGFQAAEVFADGLAFQNDCHITAPPLTGAFPFCARTPAAGGRYCPR